MVHPRQFITSLHQSGISFFTGVPDSLLKEFCFGLSDLSPATHVTAANEGAAVALAAGHYLATGNLAFVYLQNSGLGNAINPLVSLADPAVYGIPMLLMIGWRGEPEIPDEPQHVRQGAITPALLETLGIPYQILPQDGAQAHEAVARIVSIAKKERRPVALIVRKGTFSTCEIANKQEDRAPMTREEALECVIESAESAHVVATTGMLSRELFEMRERHKESHARDFLTVGSMGHASSIALGIALARPGEPVWCLDGDGALLMHLGSLTTIGKSAPKNLWHVVFNNRAHDSVGGHPTAADTADLVALAKAAGYPTAFSATNQNELVSVLASFARAQGPAFLEIHVRRGARGDLGRPTETPRKSADAFRGSFG